MNRSHVSKLKMASFTLAKLTQVQKRQKRQTDTQTKWNRSRDRNEENKNVNGNEPNHGKEKKISNIKIFVAAVIIRIE